MSMIRTVSKNKRLRIIGALVCVLAIVLTSVFVIPHSFADDPATTIQINTAAQLVAYATEYAAGSHNPDDVIQLALSQGSAFVISSDAFEGIGTSSRPFNGKVEIVDNAVSNFFLDAPLFKYITTDAKIVNASNQTRTLNIARINTDIDSPLFAENVVAGAVNTGADWSVKLVADNTDPVNATSNDFAGVIKNIDAGSKVHVSFEHDSIASTGIIANVKSADDVGLICGTLGAGAELSVDIAANHNFNVQSTGGNAGGIVGTMAAGSKVVLPDGFASVSNVTAGGGYAGGIAGEATDAAVTVADPTTQSVTVSKTVSGTLGAGGVYGKYTSNNDNSGNAGGTRTFNLAPLHSDSNLTLTGSGNVGGVIGELSATNNVTVDGGITLGATDNGTYDRTVILNGGSARGGVIGSYQNSSLDNVLEIENNKVSVSSNAAGTSSPAIGGVIGKIAGSGASYVKIHDVAVKNTGSNNLSASLIGDMGTAGSFLDTDGYIAACGKYGAGLVYAERAGVIRLKGVTDLGGKYLGEDATTDEGQLVASRVNGLIYALGSGADSDNTTTGWTFRRGTTSRIDDVGDWGEVLRLKSEYNGLSESDFFTVDMTHHTVTVAAHVANMATIKDFIKTALNIQLNDQDRGSLKFASSASRRDTVLESNLSITDDISLEKTGIVSLMRDNGTATTLKGYSGTFTGNNKTVTLAIGEPYGYSGTSNTALTSSDRGNNNYGTVFGHTLLGLFSKTASGASISGLTTDGYISLAARFGKDYSVGGIVGYVTGTGTPLTLTNITTSQQNLVFITNNNASVRCGGAVGEIADGTAGTLSVSNCTFDNETIETRSAGSGYFGGGVGYVASTSDLTMNFNTVTLSGTYDNTASSATGNVHYGGLISYIVHASNIENRKLNLLNITVANDVSVNNKTSGNARSTGSGAFLGSEWYDTKVTVGTDGSSTDGVTIGSNDAGDGPTITVASGSGNCNIGALVYRGTGYWRVNNVKVYKAVINASNGSNKSFGFIANDGIYSTDTEKCALYLELVSDHYDIAATTINGAPAVFDEVVAYSHNNNQAIDANGQAIISIRTASGSPVVMTGSSCNTYQNQTTYGKASNRYNSHSRYYYNLDSIRTKVSPTNAEKLLMWSVNTYAQSKIKQYFANGFTADSNGVCDIYGDCDMDGLSYYPVNASGMTIGANGATTVTFYNKEIEDGEALSSGGSDSLVRSTRNTVVNATQHYLMHSGIFLNYVGDMSVDDLTLQGSVGRQNFGSGFIVARNLGGDDDETSRINLADVVIDGAYVNDVSGCSPLIINDIDINTSLDIDGLKQQNYASLAQTYAASSLIGDVGSDTATNISLNFSEMVLDGRSTALSGDTDLNTAYGTTKSIFSRATFLNSFAFVSSGLGVYNYEYSEDWGTTKHQVTYAKEITTSVEYANKQKHYYDDSTNFTNPVSGTSPTTEYDFSTGFLPHVWNDSSLNLAHPHEVRVNVKDIALIVGCGQYNDPYIITDGGMFATAANIIYGVPDPNIKVTLPDDCDGSPDMWCDYVLDNTNATKDRVYTYIGGQFVADDGSGNKTLAKVREYLAGAYYKVQNNIDLPSDYKGLGALSDWSTSTDYTCEYAFRGVIVGSGLTIITNNSDNPLVKCANGCVVKGVTMNVAGDIEIGQETKVLFRYDSAGCSSYGAVIGQVMGGDNIIDTVGVDFREATFIVGTGNRAKNQKIVPVGGYVGVIVNGGVIFRGMSGIAPAYKSGLTTDIATISTLITSKAWLFVNPIIGRVLSGYAFTESSSYEYNEASVMMKNGKNNYSIPDIKSTGLTINDKINVTVSSSKHVISAPNAQSLYLLAAIVNSGAGSASIGDGTSGENTYQDIDGTPWIAYREYCSTRCAAYSDVATGISSSADYDIVKDYDVYKTSTKVPYIIKQYTRTETVGSKDLYRARSICAASNNVSSISLSSTTPVYYLPASFRGIGSLFYDSSLLRLEFSSFDGKLCTISYNTYYLDYDMAGGNGVSNGITKRTHDNYCNIEHVGLGLFSQFKQYNVNANNKNSIIKDFTVAGTIYYDIVKQSNGGSIQYTYEKAKEESIGDFCVLNVGGVVGTVRGNNDQFTNIRIENVTLGAINFNGAKSVGGLIGSCSVIPSGNNKPLRYIENCGSAQNTSINLTAGLNAGGIVGSVSRNIYVNGVSTKTYLYIDKIIIKAVKTDGGDASKADYEYGDKNVVYSGGGLIGKTDQKYSLSVKNYAVIGIDNAGNNIYGSNQTASTIIYAGGIIGNQKNGTIDIENILIQNMNLYGTRSGGLYGSLYSDQLKSASGRDPTVVNAKNITVDGGSDRSSIKGLLVAGGVFGKDDSTNANGATVINLTNCKVVNYDISSESTVNSSERAAGGLIGFSRSLSADGHTFNVYNCTVDHCNIASKTNEQGTETGLGGLFGLMKQSFFTGVNVLLNGTSVNFYSNGSQSATTSRATAALVGNVEDSETSYVKLVGVSIQGMNAQPRLCGNYNIPSDSTATITSEVFGPNGYVVLADYDGTCTSSPNTSRSSLIAANSSADMAAADPYVTVNPALDAGSSGLKLTGDGMSATVAGLPVQDILGNDWRYLYSKSNISVFNPYSGKLSTFNSEQGTSLSDFAVLTVEDTSRINTTAMINSYINLISNTNQQISYTDTQFGYADDLANVYSVDIYRMIYDDATSKFIIDPDSIGADPTTEPCLRRGFIAGANQFYFTDEFDTQGVMFSLIDVKYLDPNDASKVAYHLYVPVIVKKIMRFDFDIATASGTNYEGGWYAANDRYGKPLMENLGSPVTIYFKYTYMRTQAEWQNAVNAGEDLMRNFSKTLSLSKSSSIPDLPNDTVLVLVDPNNGGKEYYAEFGDVYSGGVLSLSGFREDLDDPTSAHFTPIDLNEYVTMTAAADGDGIYITCPESEATAKATLNGTPTYFRPKEDGDSGTTYSLTVTSVNDASGYVPAVENYYISFFTDPTTSSTVYHYTISCPSTFGDPVIPSRINDLSKLTNEGSGNAHLILGNIFVQSNYTLNASGAEEMSAANDTVNVAVNSTIKIASSLKPEVVGYLGVDSAIQVYHSFLINLTKNDENGSRKIITGYPTAAGTFTVASDNGTVASAGGSYGSFSPNMNYAEYALNLGTPSAPKGLNEYLTDGDGAVISSNVTLRWSGDDNILEQFPTKANDADRTKGVTVSGQSNVGFDTTTTALSKSSVSMTDGNNKLYYCRISEDKAKLYYNAKGDVFEGDYATLGINPLDNNGLTRSTVSTIAVHDISKIMEQTVGYDLVRAKFKLTRRQDNYATPLNIDTYVKNLHFVGFDTTDEDYSEVSGDGLTEYVFIFPRSWTDQEAETSLVLPIDFTVVTGGEFEGLDLCYSNYKITLTVELIKEREGGGYDALAVSQDSNYLIYTNARLIPDFILVD